MSGRLCFFLFQGKLFILFSVYFLVYFGKVLIWPMYHSLQKKIWFTSMFLPLKESLTLFQIWIFLLYVHLFCLIWSYRKYRVTKINFKYLNENCGYSSCHNGSIPFLYASAHKGFALIIFELDYHWASLSLHFHIVLESLVSY